MSEHNSEMFYGYFTNNAEGKNITVVANDNGGVGVAKVLYYTVNAEGKESEIQTASFVKPGKTDAADDETADDKISLNGVSVQSLDNDEYAYISIPTDFKGYVYVRAIDFVGNEEINDYTTDAGLIIESKTKHEDGESSELTLTPQATNHKDYDGNPLYGIVS